MKCPDLDTATIIEGETAQRRTYKTGGRKPHRVGAHAPSESSAGSRLTAVSECKSAVQDSAPEVGGGTPSRREEEDMHAGAGNLKTEPRPKDRAHARRRTETVRLEWKSRDRDSD
eukprot:2034929-Rhodomonas_salina.3